MAPPARCAAQSRQARGLGRHAVNGHQLLLLADRVEEAQRVRAEADQPDRRERRQAPNRACARPQALAPARGCEQQEGQHQPGGDLDPHARDQRAGGGAEARAGSCGERQRGGEQQQDQRVVVRPADRQLEQNRVQAHERRRPAPRVTEAAGGSGDHRHGGEARGDGDRLERPQPAGEPQRSGRVAGEREQGPVGGVLEGPSHEREDRIGRRFGGEMRVGIQAVQGSHAGKAQIAEHVLRDQRRAQEQNHVRGHDRRHKRAHRQRSRREQHQQVARAHAQRQGLEAAFADSDVQTLERARHPARPAAAASGDVRRGACRGAGRQEEDGRDQTDQANRAERTQSAGTAFCGRSVRTGCPPRPVSPTAADLDAGCGGRGLHRLIVTSTPRLSVWWAR
jgi:hypothetical protein